MSVLTTLTLSPKPLRTAFCSASAQSLASISTAVTLRSGARASRHKPAAPTPAPASSTRLPPRAGTAAARNTASLPALWPPRGWVMEMRPPRKASALVAPRPSLVLLFVGDDMADTGLGENTARPRNSHALHQDAPGKSADRALEHAHIGVGDNEADVSLLEEGADIGQKHRVV